MNVINILKTMSKMRILLDNLLMNETIEAYLTHCEDHIINLTDSDTEEASKKEIK